MDGGSKGTNQFKTEAEKIMELLNLLTLFTRKTLLEWLPAVTDAFGVSEERFMVLYELELQPNISLKDLARNVMVSSSSLSIMINSLVEQELVERVTDPKDRRKVLLKLSRRGEEVLNKANDHLIQSFQSYLSGLSPQSREKLEKTGDAMVSIIKQVMKESMKG
ncbi:MarR family winged helix-turn-helix transcriptional regulator [Tindallia californiensis]|uniref:DNA-binding transcriptional regulator, MarR family n=1 Tax=Tindallia californiensis TaxID=159292 RepID=A0A1H3MDQ0_9FIRM|nr:MarR family transcriptional regulator [Tindallia californiensis]SDY74703.1 DNA-binding transcriptional regulator, MarR family [Tindallia californiensis]